MGTPPSTGESIIKALKERYSRLRTYRDRGAVYGELGTEGPAVEMTFETAYASPNLFRFAFDSPHPFQPLKHLITRCVVGCDGTQSYLRIEYPGEPADLRIADDVATVVAGATGISGGSVHTIARLLLGGSVASPCRAFETGRSRGAPSLTTLPAIKSSELIRLVSSGNSWSREIRSCCGRCPTVSAEARVSDRSGTTSTSIARFAPTRSSSHAAKGLTDGVGCRPTTHRIRRVRAGTRDDVLFAADVVDLDAVEGVCGRTRRTAGTHAVRSSGSRT